MYTSFYSCDVLPEMKQEMGAWSKGFFPWLRTQEFIFHRSMRSASINSPELVAYFDFEDEASAQELKRMGKPHRKFQQMGTKSPGIMVRCVVDQWAWYRRYSGRSSD